MSKRAITLVKSQHSYSFNKTKIPFPEPVEQRIKPPTSNDVTLVDSSELFKPLEKLPVEEKARQLMDEYRKAERALVINFYTGGGPYKKGIMDSIYRGFNPLNP